MTILNFVKKITNDKNLQVKFGLKPRIFEKNRNKSSQYIHFNTLAYANFTILKFYAYRTKNKCKTSLLSTTIIP